MPGLRGRSTLIRTRHWVAQNLAARLSAQPWTLPSIAIAIGTMLRDMHPQTRAALARRVMALGDNTYPPSPQDIVAFLLRSEFFNPKPDSLVAVVLDPPVFAPLPRFAGLPLPALATVGDPAAWLALSAEELDWFSDERHGQDHARISKLRHYHYVLTRKRDGSPRLLEAPKSRLKAIQRRILREILTPVPVHDSAHGFVPGRSCLAGAQIHASEAIVATLDLAEFFPSIGAPRIHGIFRALGYPWAVARRLTGLCTTVTPLDCLNGMAILGPIYRVRHLPQGSPTSPALANLLTWRLDRRLSGLARAAGANYTRYADDLAFSGDADFARSIARFCQAVAIIADQEGFRVNPNKTRMMLRHQRQRVTGLVVNNHISVGRAGFDRLKAILHNCARGNPHDQNRAGVPDFRRHLEGRVAWVEQVNPHLGGKLRLLFERIDWSG